MLSLLFVVETLVGRRLKKLSEMNRDWLNVFVC